MGRYEVTDEIRKKVSVSAKRRAEAPEFLERVRAQWKPFCSEEQLRADYESANMSQAEICIKYEVTLKRVQTSFRRYGIKPRRQIIRNQVGSNNSCWKGDDASYTAFHFRVESVRGKPQECERCQTSDPSKRYEWANLTGNYGNVDDYARMCRSCHRRFDYARRCLTGERTIPVHIQREP